MAEPQRGPRIDFHAHLLEERANRLGLPNSPVTGFGKTMPKADPGTAWARALEGMFDPDKHAADLARLDIDAEVLSSATVQMGTSWAPPALEDEINREVNDEIARWVSLHPTRIIGSFTLPLQDRGRTIEELDRCTADLEMRVVQLPACVHGVYMGDEPFRYLWEEIAARNLAVFMHPDGTRDLWFQQYSMWNSVGQPIEEAKLIASLIYGGVLEDFPDLGIVIAHGGGYLPHYFGRLDRNVKAWPASTKNISKKPSEYLHNLYYDTCLYEPRMLDALIDRVGADRVVMGSDYPVGETDPLGFIADSPRVSAAEARQIQGETAARILGCDRDPQGGIAFTGVPV